MNSIIQWCNENQGFAGVILSFLTIVIGIIAIVISVQTARLPFKKKVKLGGSIGYIFDSNTTPEIGKIFVSACNIGNRDIYIKFLGYAIKRNDNSSKVKYDLLHNAHFKNGNNIMLKAGEVTEVPYSFEYFMRAMVSVDPGRKIYFYLEDSEGKITTKMYMTVGEFLSLYNQ